MTLGEDVFVVVTVLGVAAGIRGCWALASRREAVQTEADEQIINELE